MHLSYLSNFERNEDITIAGKKRIFSLILWIYWFGFYSSLCGTTCKQAKVANLQSNACTMNRNSKRRKLDFYWHLFAIYSSMSYRFNIHGPDHVYYVVSACKLTRVADAELQIFYWLYVYLMNREDEFI